MFGDNSIGPHKDGGTDTMKGTPMNWLYQFFPWLAPQQNRQQNQNQNQNRQPQQQWNNRR